MEYPSDIDKELIPLLDTLNEIEGVRTLFSCSGHGEVWFEKFSKKLSPFYVSMSVSSMKSLEFIRKAIYDFNVEYYSENQHIIDVIFENWPYLSEKTEDEMANGSICISLRLTKVVKPLDFKEIVTLSEFIHKELDIEE